MTMTQDQAGGQPAPPGGAAAAPVVLATYGLTKSFGGTLAVDHLDLTVRRGDVFGFLGPQRRRQDHHDPHDRRADLPDQRLRRR